MQLATTINFLRTEIVHVFSEIDDTEGTTNFVSIQIMYPTANI